MLQSGYEVCICSAIKRKSDGKIFRGQRHDDCIQSAGSRGWSTKDTQTAEQGFMTSANRFVDRKEAYQLQVEAGRVPDRPGSHILMSEDLY